MPGRVDAVTIEVATESRRCAIVSVQNNTVSNLIVAILPCLIYYTEYDHSILNLHKGHIRIQKIHYEKS